MTTKKSVIRRTKGKELLKCDLSQAELLAYGEKMADAQQEAISLKNQMDSVKKEFTGKIEALTAQAENIGGKIRAKYEHREVPTEKIEDFTDKRVTLIRMDTGETVQSRDMTDHELEQLPLDAKPEDVSGE